uniref:AAA+ ATPase domain-containing protein n=1 Tax=Salix viminalis TaxID=40686 RepID=A0A6N2LDA9_SALVM
MASEDSDTALEGLVKLLKRKKVEDDELVDEGVRKGEIHKAKKQKVESKRSMMLIRSMANELIPFELRSYLSTAIHYLFTPLSTNTTLVIDEHCGMSRNQVYDAAEIYLKTKISPSTERLRIGKTSRQKTFSVAIEKGEVVADVYENIKLKWAYVCTEPQKTIQSGEKRRFELSFNKKYREKIMDSYLPHVLKRAKELKDEEKVVKLYNRECPFNNEDGGDHGGMWGSINLEHPSTFDTLALDPELKKMIVDDLKRFLGRKEFYKKVGKAWKRGYLLSGPPGTGKSSLIAAMANYLKFDIYDLELTSIYSNSDLRRVLLSTTNRSILVIEDIDCSVEMRDRQQGGDQYGGSPSSRLTLSGLLNFIDGLWSSCGDERIIVFTTNHKDRLDSALLRPGRMDVHINMSYCKPQAFSTLASNYLDIRDKNHDLYEEIEGLMEITTVTPAEVAEELMASENADVALEGLVNFLKRKHSEANQVKSEENDKEKCKETVTKRRLTHSKLTPGGAIDMSLAFGSGLTKIHPKIAPVHSIALNFLPLSVFQIELWKMDPDAVKSTLTNLAFGNVIAAAARNYQKEILAQEKAQSSSAFNEEVDLDELMDDPELEKLHADRIASLKKEAEKREALKRKGHGEYREIDEGDFLGEVTGTEKAICHFYHKEFYRCKIMDKHLKALAPRHVDTKFIKLDAENAPFFVAKLGVKTLPCVVLFSKGVAMDRLVGFQDIGGKDDFSTRTLELILIKKGIISEKKDNEGDEDDDYRENSQRTVRSSTNPDSDSD